MNVKENEKDKRKILFDLNISFNYIFFSIFYCLYVLTIEVSRV